MGEAVALSPDPHHIPAGVHLPPPSFGGTDLVSITELLHVPIDVDDEPVDNGEKANEQTTMTTAYLADAEEPKLLWSSSYLPQPEAPPALTNVRSTGPDELHSVERSDSFNAAAAVDVAAIGKYIRDRSNSFSAAIAKRISSLKESPPESDDCSFTEIHLSGVKVIVRLKEPDRHEPSIKGRISFFSRSGCRDCDAVRSFFREKGLPYVEINVDVFPEREKELVERAGSAAVPAIFFNEKLLGGLVTLNSLRNSGEFDQRLREMAGRRCPEDAPRMPAYGFDDEEEAREQPDALISIVKVLRHRLPIQDRVTRLKIVKNCFAAGDIVDGIMNHLDCSRKAAVEVCKELARKHFIHHVIRENDFIDGNNQFYRFLEHDPAITKCFNFRGSTNDNEPKPAILVAQRLTKLMTAMLEAYTSDDRCHLDYSRIGSSEEFRRYLNLVQELHRVDLFSLSSDEKLTFFLNLYNAMVIHAIIRIGQPSVIEGNAFYSDFQYVVGGYPYSPSTVKNGILRSNQRQPYSLIKPFSGADRRLTLMVEKVNPLIHFGLCNGTRSSPTVRFFSPQGIDIELRHAAREFFLNGGLEVDIDKRTVHLTRVIKWYSADFGHENDTLKWILNYLESTKAGLLTHLLNDGCSVNISYQNFDWSLNS